MSTGNESKATDASNSAYRFSFELHGAAVVSHTLDAAWWPKRNAQVLEFVRGSLRYFAVRLPPTGSVALPHRRADYLRHFVPKPAPDAESGRESDRLPLL